MFEGALLFAGAAARRLSAQSRSKAVFPFTVDNSASGYGTSSGAEYGQSARAEFWAPVWESPAGLNELTHLVSEGRAQLGRRQAADRHGLRAGHRRTGRGAGRPTVPEIRVPGQERACVPGSTVGSVPYSQRRRGHRRACRRTLRPGQLDERPPEICVRQQRACGSPHMCRQDRTRHN